MDNPSNGQAGKRQPANTLSLGRVRASGGVVINQGS